jgi:N-acetylglucosamine-6-sulfatase
MERTLAALRLAPPVVFLSVMGLAAFVVARTAFATCEVTVVDQHRPNIVVVLADDLDMTLFEETPRLRELRGRTYPNAFTVSPLCCPSRASLLTGLYPHHHGVLDNVGPRGGHASFVRSGIERCALPVWLQAAGYHTAYVGKYLNGYGSDLTSDTYVPPGWDDWQGLPVSNRYHGYNMNDNGQVIYPKREQTAELTERALTYLGAAEPPFFLMVAPFAPHQVVAAERTEETGGRAFRLVLAKRLADMVTSLVEALPPDTLLVFTSDNGYHEQPSPGKRLPYDTDTRVPLVVVGLEGRDDRLAPNIDVTATIAEWAGVERAMDGQSLFGPERDEFLIELDGWRAIRTRESLTIHWPDGRIERTTTGCPDSRAC